MLHMLRWPMASRYSIVHIVDTHSAGRSAILLTGAPIGPDEADFGGVVCMCMSGFCGPSLCQPLIQGIKGRMACICADMPTS